MFLRGEISTQEREAVDSVNGHSAATVRLHYLKRSRERDATDTLQVARVGTTVPRVSPCFSPSNPNNTSTFARE